MSHEPNSKTRRNTIVSTAALLCFLTACGEVSNPNQAGQGGVAGGAVGENPRGGRPSSSPGSGGTAPVVSTTGGVGSAIDGAGTNAGTNAGAGADSGALPDICALPMDGAGSSNDSVGPPPNGYLVYMAETASEGKQIYHVRIHDGVVAPAVRLTSEAGIDGYAVVPQRPAVVSGVGDRSSGFSLTLVDFDESGPTGSAPLPIRSGEIGVQAFTSFGTNPDGSLLFASPGIRFFDLRPVTPTSQDLGGYNITESLGWNGSRLLFSGTKTGSADRRWFSVDPGASPPVATPLTDSTGTPSGLSLAPNKARAIYTEKSSSGDIAWYLVDLTAAVPAQAQLTAAALRVPVRLGISTWSPDSRYYLAEVESGGLVLVDVEHPAGAEVVSTEGATKLTFAQFSPDSQRLVYVAQDDSQKMHLYGVALGPEGPSAAYPLIRGTEEEQEAYVNQPGLLEWMQDSRYVAYLGQNPHAFYVADAYGCSGRRFRFTPEQSEPFTLNGIHAAPGARRFAFFSDYESPGAVTGVYVTDIVADGSWGEPTRISGSVNAGLAQEIRFLDGDWLMYYAEDAARRAALYVAPRDGSTPARLLNDPNDAILYTAWVPDSP